MPVNIFFFNFIIELLNIRSGILHQTFDPRKRTVRVCKEIQRHL